ncbi:MAG: glycosyl hydrolase family 28-related protein [Armatimonadia bacterium]
MKLWLLALSVVAVSAACAAPVAFWASSPVGPDETVLLMGGNWGDAPVVELAPLSGPLAVPAVFTQPPTLGQWKQFKPLQITPNALKFIWPIEHAAPGVYACRVRSGAQVSPQILLNAPDPWWLQGDEGGAATPSGWVRVFGRCVSMSAKAVLALRDAAGKLTPLADLKGDQWNLRARLPASLPAGEYEVLLSSGWGTATAGKLTVIPPVKWKTDVFNLADFGTDPTTAMQAALAKAAEDGGGVVYIPRGRYQIKESLTIPPGTTLRGEGMALVSLYWPDFETPPDALIVANDCAIENLTLYCQNHRVVIRNDPESERLRVNKVRIRANAFFMFGEPGAPFRGKNPPPKMMDGHVFRLSGRNYQITDCDLWGSGAVFSIDPHRFTGTKGPWHGVISGNTVAYGSTSHVFENLDGLVYEHNDVRGRGTSAGGNGINTFWNNFSRNLYYANNVIHDMYGLDREMMTLDAGGGAYFGKIAAVDGNKLTLAADPTYKDYAPTPHTDWSGAAFMILDGTGAGQYRLVTRNEGRQWEVDKPFDLPPDANSLISIAPHRGRHLFVNNRFEDGGAFQLYGAALDTIVAGNKGARMDGFFAWGLNPHDWGWQPCFNCQFLDNEITEGNGYSYRSAFLGAVTGNNNELYPGPLARAIILRRNVLQSNARLRFGGTISDALAENCVVKNNEIGVDIRAAANGVLFRNNKFENVTTPYSGDGVEKAMIIPAPK